MLNTYKIIIASRNFEIVYIYIEKNNTSHNLVLISYRLNREARGVHTQGNWQTQWWECNKCHRESEEWWNWHG